MVLDRRGIILDANETMCRRFQKQAHGLRGVCVWDLLSPDIAKLRESSVDKVFQSGKPVRIVDERDGHWFDNVVHPVFDAKGNVSKVAILARDITEMKRKEKELEEKDAELETKSKNVEEVNTALRVLLKQRTGDKAELEEKVLSNVKDLVLPYVERLKKTSLGNNQMFCVDILESNLKEIISPFSRKLSSKYLGLTPTEIRVANLIKDDKTTKEIAEFMNVSAKTIETHRDNIRKKMGIKHKKTNLRTYLSSVQ
jgi:PAS domain S-box-containing protein